MSRLVELVLGCGLRGSLEWLLEICGLTDSRATPAERDALERQQRETNAFATIPTARLPRILKRIDGAPDELIQLTSRHGQQADSGDGTRVRLFAIATMREARVPMPEMTPSR